MFKLLADVIAMVSDGIATYGGWCLADVIAMVADGIATSQLISFLVLRCFSRYLIPYMWQIEFVYISI